MPAGPAPIITGRSLSGSLPGGGQLERRFVVGLDLPTAAAPRQPLHRSPLVPRHDHFDRVDETRPPICRGRRDFCARSATARCRSPARRARGPAAPARPARARRRSSECWTGESASEISARVKSERRDHSGGGVRRKPTAPSIRRSRPTTSAAIDPPNATRVVVTGLKLAALN